MEENEGAQVTGQKILVESNGQLYIRNRRHLKRTAEVDSTPAEEWPTPSNHHDSRVTRCCRLKFENGQIWANNTQQVATHRNTVAKRTQHVAPNNVKTCCVGMLRSFGRGLRSINVWRSLHFRFSGQNWALIFSFKKNCLLIKLGKK